MVLESKQLLQYILTPKNSKEGKRFELRDEVSGVIGYISGKVGERLYRLFQMHEEGLTSEQYNCHGLSRYLQGRTNVPEYPDFIEQREFSTETTVDEATDSLHFPIGVYVRPDCAFSQSGKRLGPHSGTLLGKSETGTLFAIQKFGPEPLEICRSDDIIRYGNCYGFGVQPNFFGKRKLTLKNIKRALGVG